MHSTAAFLSMPNAEGIVLGGPPDQGFNDNSARGYPAWLSITTRQVTDVVTNDLDIISVKGGRQVSGPEPYLDDVARDERIRQICASKYLYGYPESKLIDPIQENYPACTMPLAATMPAVVAPEILCNTQYVHDYVKHVALIREMLGQASLSVNPTVLERCSNQLLKGVAGLLKGMSNCQHTREPIPAWNTVRVVRTKPTASLVNSTTSLMIHDEAAHLNMPCAPMPIPDTDETSAMHPALVTALTLSKLHYRQGGLIQEGLFWKSSRLAVHETVLEYQLHLDPNDSAQLKQNGEDTLWMGASSTKEQRLQPNTGLHKSLAIDCVQGNPQYWISWNSA